MAIVQDGLNTLTGYSEHVKIGDKAQYQELARGKWWCTWLCDPWTPRISSSYDAIKLQMDKGLQDPKHMG